MCLASFLAFSGAGDLPKPYVEQETATKRFLPPIEVQEILRLF